MVRAGEKGDWDLLSCSGDLRCAATYGDDRSCAEISEPAWLPGVLVWLFPGACVASLLGKALILGVTFSAEGICKITATS